jgi:type I restriction enzyme R subunit
VLTKYLNTLYVDKNLKYHGLIQAFSRTNRILNDTKPWGNILDFRQQQEAVNDAITLFSGSEQAGDKEIWLVDDAPKVISKYQAAVQKLETFMTAQGLTLAPEQVSNLKGDEARAQFVTLFKDIQKIKTQLDQYTDLTEDDVSSVEQVIANDQLRAFRSMYLETAQRLKEKQDKNEGSEEVEQLDFEFVLFASAMVDYDYIVKLMKDLSQSKGDKQSMSRAELISLILSDAKFMDERDDLVAYIDTLKAGEALSEAVIRQGYESFKAEQSAKQLVDIAQQHQLSAQALQAFVARVMQRMVFDGEALSDLLAPLNLGWKARAKQETELMVALMPLFHKLAKGRDISGLKAYE